MSDFDCHECECYASPGRGDWIVCSACEDCLHGGESFPHCPTSCEECDCLTRYELRQERDKNVKELLNSAPEAIFDKVYGYIIAGEVYWKHEGGIFEQLSHLAGLEPRENYLSEIWYKQSELAALSGAVLNPDEDFASLVERDRVITLGVPVVIPVKVEVAE